MGIRSEWVRVGAVATQRLAAVVAEAQGGDPLAAVSVIVPTNPVGVTARRALGSRSGGVANVAFTTLDQLAHEVAAAGLEAHGRHQLTDQIRAAAVRISLRRDPRCFAAVAEHPSTDRAVADALAQIRRAGPEARAALGSSSRRVVADVLRIGSDVEELLAGYYDEVDLATVASSLIDPPGPVILHLPGWLTPAQRSLVVDMARRTDVVVLAGSVGDSAVDSQVAEMCAGLGAPLGPAPSERPPAPCSVRSVSDPDDECRHAVRWLLARREEGVPFERMAVFYSSSEPYRRALHRHLESAGIPNNGPAVATVGETVAGRFVRSVLGLVESDFRRDDVMALVSSGPIISPDGVVVRSTLWERTTRSSGVVRGLDQWRSRLSARRTELLAAQPSPESWRTQEAGTCTDVLRFVESLAADLAELDSITSWRGFAAWLVAMLHRYLAAPGGRSRWPEHEREAAERFELTIGLLASLDAVEPDPSRIALEAGVAVELDRATRRAGRLGEGVLVGPLSAGVGADLDAVVIVGAVEGLAPRPVRHGVILGAVEHATVGRDLGGDSIEGQAARYLGALAAAPQARRLVLTSRGDLRSGRVTFPSRWIEGCDVASVPSAASAWSAAASDPPATIAEYQLRRLGDSGRDITDAGAPIIAAVPRLAAGAHVVAGRRWGGLTEWSGRVSGPGLRRLLDRELSASALERYARCPFEFLMQQVLVVRDVEKPEDVETIDPRERGVLIHAALERLVAERIARGGSVEDESAELERLLELVEEELDHFEQTGRVGRPLRWELERSAISAQAVGFFELDLAARRSGAVAERTEFAFGDESGVPTVVEIGDGRRLRFRGSADRVDRAADGAVVVIDYKTIRKAKSEDDILADVHRGRLLQLPLYARAAEAVAGGGNQVPARAGYWYLPRVKGPGVAMVDLGEVEPRFIETLGVLADGIDGGRFPAVPGDATNYPRPTHDHCIYCSYDAVCHAEREEIWERSAADPAMAAFVELTTRDLVGAVSEPAAPVAAEEDGGPA